MKISKVEFKGIIKECLKELISEGALDYMVGGMIAERAAMQDPRVQQAASMGVGLIEQQVYADTMMNSVPEQQNAGNRLPNGMQLPQGMNMNMIGVPLPNGIVPTTGYVPQRNQLPPRDPNAPTLQQQALQEQYNRQQQTQGGPATNWARLAFNKPISNRPNNQTQNGLPGTKKGSFE